MGTDAERHSRLARLMSADERIADVREEWWERQEIATTGHEPRHKTGQDVPHGQCDFSPSNRLYGSIFSPASKARRARHGILVKVIQASEIALNDCRKSRL